ncbi:MAG: AzlC family ABC transporter permease [Eubacterium sp.]|nr:AzlC family ABC transporter permease [Eubacterium sp.]
MEEFKKGLRDGIPIALGYFAVSFSFGILGALDGLGVFETVFISMTNLTSAGQFAGLEIMAAGGSLLEMALTQFFINLRYSLMSISLSQKVDGKFSGIYRVLLGFCITDEIFAVSSVRKEAVTRLYFLGLATLPYIGWSGGTLVGVVMGNVLPGIVVTSLGIALYGMFIAIVVPVARDEFPVMVVSLMAVVGSCILYFVPAFSGISSGFAIIICCVLCSAIGACLFPVPEEAEGEEAGS